jgi:hypothetical protein
MQKIGSIVILISLLISFSNAQEEYPSFSKEYWENEVEVAQGKIVRGAALGIAGAILIWPTVVMISKAEDNPHKYIPLSIVFGAASIGAIGHGFSSVANGKKERSLASDWVEKYSNSSDSIDNSKEENDYIDYQKKSAMKTTIFGAYTISIAATLLTNGIIQSSRSDEEISSDNIHILPYYIIGGTLLPMGIFSIVKSRRKDSELDELKTTTNISSRSQFIPYVTFTLEGKPLYGAFYRMTF